MFVWISKRDRIEEQQRLLTGELEKALVEQELEQLRSEVITTRGALTATTRTADKLAHSNGEMSQTIMELRAELAGARARADAMDAAMSERGIEKLVGRSVVIHTAGLHSIEGVLTDVYPDLVVLKHAYYVDAESGSRETLTGEIKVPRPFEFVQELTRDAGPQNS